MIDVDSHHSSKSSEDEEEDNQTDEETEGEVSEEGSIGQASSSGEEEEEDEEEHLEAADELKLLKSHPSLTPTPPTDDDQPTSSAETVLHRLRSDKVASSTIRQANPTELRPESLERIIDTCLEEEGGEIEESGPALVIVKSLDETDEDFPEQPRQASFPDEAQKSIKEELGYNPDAEYLSDPDFHDERPGKNTSKNDSQHIEQSRESEKLRERFRRQTKVTEQDSDTIDESESVGSVEQDTACASDINLALETAGDNDNVTSDLVESDPVGSDSNVKEEEEEEEEVDEEEDTEDEEEDISDGASEHSRTTFIIKLPAESSSENEIHEEIEDSTGREQVVEEFVVKLDEFESEIEPVVQNEDRAEAAHIEDPQYEEGGSTGARSIKPSRIENQASEDQTEDASDNQVTASEAQAELFIDESTLAEDIASLQCSIALKRLSETVSTTSEADRVQEYEHDEDVTCAEDIAIEETAPVLRPIERTRHRELKASNSRQESLDDVESEVLDSNYIAEPVQTLAHNEVQMSQQNIDDVGSGAISSDKMLLTEQVSDYCDTLADSITNEAVQKVDFIAAKATSLVEQSLFKALECTSSVSVRGSELLKVYNSEEDDLDSHKTTSQRKIYTSSMYYDDKQNSFPTIEQQLECSRRIAKQLEIGLLSVEESPSNRDGPQEGLSETDVADTSSQLACDGSSSGSDRRSRARRHQSERASFMFGRRRERADQFTVESSIEDSSSLADVSQCSLPPRCRQPSARLQRRRASLEPASLTCYKATILDRDEAPRRPRERRRLSLWDSLSVSDNDLTALTDTEYEAPRVRRRAQPTRATTTPFRERTSRLVEVDNSDKSTVWDQSAEGNKGREIYNKRPTSSLKPFLDSSTLKDIERLRNWTPFEEFNEHNSVSPEICLKLVQDLKSCGTIHNELAESTNVAEESLAGVSRTNSASIKCKGAQLFERRQLQSSDWIVEDKSSQADKKVTKEEHTSGSCGVLVSDDLEKVDEDAAEAADIQQQVHHARPSLSEETLLVTDESSLPQLVELVPAVVMSYSQPQLEVATVTRTPSFSASSWRVIECDSPDLLTSRDDEEEECNLSQSETIGNDDGDDDDLMEEADHTVEQQLGGVLAGGKLQENAIFSHQDEPNSSYSEPAVETRLRFEDHEATLTPEVQFAEAATGGTNQMSSVPRWKPQEPFEDLVTPLRPISVTTRVKSQARASELHQASLVEWRPQVMTPTRMTSSASVSESSALDRDETLRSVAGGIRNPPGPMESHHTRPPINHRRRCSSLTHEQGSSMRGYSNLQQQCAEFTAESAQLGYRSSVSSMRGNYQNLIDDVHYKSPTHTKYRAYHYPFANRDRLRAFESHHRSKSLLRDEIVPFSAPTSPPLPQRTDSMRADIQQYLANLRVCGPSSTIRDSRQHPADHLLTSDGHSELFQRAEPSYSQTRQVDPVNSSRLSTGLLAGAYDTSGVAEHPPQLSSVMGSQQSSQATMSGSIQTFPVRREPDGPSANLAEQLEFRSYLSSACSRHQQETPQNISEQCNLRVCIKLPHKLHKIIICRMPNVTFATVMHQE